MPQERSALTYYSSSNNDDGSSDMHNNNAYNQKVIAAMSPEQQAKLRRNRLGRIFIVYLLFAITSLYKLNQHTFLVNSFMAFMHLGGSSSDSSNNSTTTTRRHLVPITHTRKWDRMLFGIFTYDSPNEADIRAANRETHLSFFKKQSIVDKGETRSDLLCTLHELLTNATLARDPESCRVVYTFVMGGGIGDPTMKYKVDKLKAGRKTEFSIKTRCLYEDPDCGGTDLTKFILDEPTCNVSTVLAHELKRFDDITLLSIPENHELGKTDTFFTYASMLTRQHPELQIGFIGKIDSDNWVRWQHFFTYLESTHRHGNGKEYSHKNTIQTLPFIYGGYAIAKHVCSGKVYGHACADPAFIADKFAAGAFVYLSTPLAQHVYMDGISLQRKQEVWIIGEDMQLGNMAYADPNIKPAIINHRYGKGGEYINTHCFNDPIRYRHEYYKTFPGLKKVYDESHFGKTGEKIPGWNTGSMQSNHNTTTR